MGGWNHRTLLGVILGCLIDIARKLDRVIALLGDIKHHRREP